MISKIDRYPFFVHREKFPLHSNKTQAFIYYKIDKNKRTNDIRKPRRDPSATEVIICAGLGVSWQGTTITVIFVLKIYKDCSILEINRIDDVNESFSVKSFPV